MRESPLGSPSPPPLGGRGLGFALGARAYHSEGIASPPVGSASGGATARGSTRATSGGSARPGAARTFSSRRAGTSNMGAPFPKNIVVIRTTARAGLMVTYEHARAFADPSRHRRSNRDSGTRTARYRNVGASGPPAATPGLRGGRGARGAVPATQGRRSMWDRGGYRESGRRVRSCRPGRYCGAGDAPASNARHGGRNHRAAPLGPKVPVESATRGYSLNTVHAFTGARCAAARSRHSGEPRPIIASDQARHLGAVHRRHAR